jgi:uncharacterized protein DUF3808
MASALFARVSPGLAQVKPVPPLMQQGVDQIYIAKPQRAIEISRALEKAFPQEPYGPIIALEAYYQMIYCQTGHINSREVWNLANVKTSFMDKEFSAAAEKTLQQAREMRRKPESAAAGALYSGLAHGARAGLYAIRQQNMASASEAKQMRTDLLDAVAKDPQIEPDADLGLGTYNYYADALSPILKLLRFFAGFPGGSREKGIEQLRTAAAKSALWSGKAKYELARLLGVREGRHSEALALFQELAAKYPDNPLYLLSAAYQAEGAGQAAEALEFAEKAQEAALKVEGVCRERFGNAATKAVARLKGTRPSTQK